MVKRSPGHIEQLRAFRFPSTSLTSTNLSQPRFEFTVFPFASRSLSRFRNTETVAPPQNAKASAATEVAEVTKVTAEVAEVAA